MKKIICYIIFLQLSVLFAVDDFVLIENAHSREIFGDDKKHSYYICDHEVTQAEFQSVMGYNPSEFKGGSRPVESVSWLEALEYCNKASVKAGLVPHYIIDDEGNVTRNFDADGYRLPTVSEWIFVARGGTLGEGYLYSGSKDIDEVAWHSGNSGKKTHKVKTKKPNELGVFDCSGNVDEWCWNSWSEESNKYFDDYYFDASTDTYIEKPFDPIDFRVSLGGNWSTDADESNACQTREIIFNGSYPDDSFNWCGFRVVLPVK